MTTADTGWFCVRSKRKAEHLAARALSAIDGIEVFCPRLKVCRTTPRGKVWFREAFFPSYLFARLDLNQHLTTCLHARWVVGLIGFGSGYACIPDAEVEALRGQFDADGVCEVPDDLDPGEETVIRSGPFRGLEVVIAAARPASERVVVLLEFLGTLRQAEVPRDILQTSRRLPGGLQA